MLSDKDREFYANLLASALVGKAKIGFSDASRLVKCNSMASDDLQLMHYFINALKLHNITAYNTLVRVVLDQSVE